MSWRPSPAAISSSFLSFAVSFIAFATCSAVAIVVGDKNQPVPPDTRHVRMLSAVCIIEMPPDADGRVRKLCRVVPKLGAHHPPSTGLDHNLSTLAVIA
jgi:hypothetical protein